MMEDREDKITIKTLTNDDDLSNLHHFTLSGLKNYWLSEELFVEEVINGETCYSYTQYDNIMAAIGLHICELPVLLGPREIKFLRLEMNMSQAILGKKLGFSDSQTVSLAESNNEGLLKQLPKAEDTLVRNFYLSALGDSEDVAAYLTKKANELLKHMDAQRRIVESVEKKYENLLLAA